MIIHQLKHVININIHICQYDTIGDTWLNGRPVPNGAEAILQVYDRVGMGDQLMMLKWPRREEGD